MQNNNHYEFIVSGYMVTYSTSRNNTSASIFRSRLTEIGRHLQPSDTFPGF